MSPTTRRVEQPITKPSGRLKVARTNNVATSSCLPSKNLAKLGRCWLDEPSSVKFASEEREWKYPLQLNANVTEIIELVIRWDRRSNTARVWADASVQTIRLSKNGNRASNDVSNFQFIFRESDFYPKLR